MGLRGPPKGSRYGGRQKGTPNKAAGDIKTLAQLHGEDAIVHLARIMNNAREDTDVRVKAMQELLNRGYGRSVAQTNLAGHDGGPLDLSALSLDQLQSMAARIVQTLAMSEDKKVTH